METKQINQQSNRFCLRFAFSVHCTRFKIVDVGFSVGTSKCNIGYWYNFPSCEIICTKIIIKMQKSAIVHWNLKKRIQICVEYRIDVSALNSWNVHWIELTVHVNVYCMRIDNNWASGSNPVHNITFVALCGHGMAIQF